LVKRLQTEPQLRLRYSTWPITRRLALFPFSTVSLWSRGEFDFTRRLEEDYS